MTYRTTADFQSSWFLDFSKKKYKKKKQHRAPKTFSYIIILFAFILNEKWYNSNKVEGFPVDFMQEIFIYFLTNI